MIQKILQWFGILGTPADYELMVAKHRLFVFEKECQLLRDDREKIRTANRELIAENERLSAECAALKLEIEGLRQRAQWPDSAAVLIGRDL